MMGFSSTILVRVVKSYRFHSAERIVPSTQVAHRSSRLLPVVRYATNVHLPFHHPRARCLYEKPNMAETMSARSPPALSLLRAGDAL